MSDLYYYAAYILTGIALGGLTLPYKNRLTQASTLQHMLSFIAAWPYLIITGAIHLIKQYYWAWIDYLNK